MPEFPDPAATDTSSPALPTATNDPTKPGERILSLDVMRAIAVLAAMLVSIWWFAGFTQNQQTKLLSHPFGGNYRLFAGISLLIEGKMRALIALVFGAGIVLLLAKKPADGKPSIADLFIRRQIWLIIFGLINGLLLLWSGDILFHLGIMGILLFAFARMRAKGLMLAGLLCTLFFVGKCYWNYADDKKVYKKYLAAVNLEKKYKADSIALAQKNTVAVSAATATVIKKDTLTKEQKENKEAWEGIVKRLKYDREKDSKDVAAMRRVSYSKLWFHLVDNTEVREAQWFYRIGIWELACMMFFGMALLKLGFFAGGFSKSQYLLLAVILISIGLLLGWYRLYFNNAVLRDYEKYISHHALPYQFFIPVERAALGLGYASLLMFLITAGWLKNVWRMLAPVGKMALTNYLMQSVICTLFFTGFGMGYYGKLLQYQLYIFVFEIWVFQIVCSILWLRYFSYGPAEWLWRCITYGAWLPNRLNKPIDYTETVVAS